MDESLKLSLGIVAGEGLVDMAKFQGAYQEQRMKHRKSINEPLVQAFKPANLTMPRAIFLDVWSFFLF